VALHRLLGARLADYDYDRHFGGVFYAFLRGMTGAAGGGVHFARPSRELVAALDAQLSGAAEGGGRCARDLCRAARRPATPGTDRPPPRLSVGSVCTRAPHPP